MRIFLFSYQWKLVFILLSAVKGATENISEQMNKN